MATLSIIPEAAPKRARFTRPMDALQPISDGRWRAALVAQCGLVLTAVLRSGCWRR